MKNLILRATTGSIYVALICFSILMGGWAFLIFFSIITVLALTEFFRMTNSLSGEGRFNHTLEVIIGLLLFLWVGVQYMIILPLSDKDILWFGWMIILPLCAVFPLYLLLRPVLQLYKKGKSPINQLAYSYLGLIYIALPMSLMPYIYMSNGKFILLGMFVMIWLSDTGAFLVGSAIGKHKLFPRISPKKSWEGFIGGLIFCVGAAFIYKYCFPDYFQTVSLGGLIGLGLVVGIFATWGDLVESMIKRTVGVKDSGNILPGHGGILDRIDSLLFVAPATLIYFLLISIPTIFY